MIEITSGRNNPMIDPHLEFWEWQIPGYLFLGGLVAGLMILNGIWRLMNRTGEGNAITRTGAVWAPILLSLGMFLLFLDLAYKMHVLKFYSTFEPTSPMSWGSWLLLLVYPVQILSIALPGGLEKFGWKLQFLNPIWSKIQSLVKNFEKPLAIMNISFGIGLGIYTGILLSALAARPLWNTALLGPLFLVSGLSAASAWNLLSKPSIKEQGALARWDITLLVTEFVFLILIIIGHLSGPAGNQEAVKLILNGPYAASFWVLVISIGIFLPLWLEIREVMHKQVPFWLGPILVLVGGLALRFVFVMAGQASFIPEDIQLLSGFSSH